MAKLPLTYAADNMFNGKRCRLINYIYKVISRSPGLINETKSLRSSRNCDQTASFPGTNQAGTKVKHNPNSILAKHRTEPDKQMYPLVQVQLEAS